MLSLFEKFRPKIDRFILPVRLVRKGDLYYVYQGRTQLRGYLMVEEIGTDAHWFYLHPDTMQSQTDKWHTLEGCLHDLVLLNMVIVHKWSRKEWD